MGEDWLADLDRWLAQYHDGLGNKTRRRIAGVRRGKLTVTTINNPKVPCPLDKVNREFRVSRPNAL